SRAIESFATAGLRFTAKVTDNLENQEAPSTFVFVDSYRRPVGSATSPDPDSVPGQVVRFCAELWDDVGDEVIDEESWVIRSREMKDQLPELPWNPTYSESLGLSLLREELRVLVDWDLVHQVRYINMNGFEDSESRQFREELAQSLARVAPVEWRALMQSSGNMHNPKVTPIWASLHEATCQTDSVSRVNQILEPHDLQIVGLSAEKLSFATKTGGGIPTAMMLFKVEPHE
ncbi:MAG: hypothetical protein AAF357_17705, partial [Verrucomicrobiota bacterium]